MKYKYQSSLSKRLVASGLAAVFSAGAFSSYVGAMEEMNPELRLSRDDSMRMDVGMQEVGVNITVGQKKIYLDSVPSDKISNDFSKYVKNDLEGAEDEKKEEIIGSVFGILRDLNYLCFENKIQVKTIWDSFEDSTIYDEVEKSSYVSYSTLYKKGYFEDFFDDFPKPFDVLYFMEKDYLKSNNVGCIDNYDELALYLEQGYNCALVIQKHLGALYTKIKDAAKKYFEDEKKLKEVKKFLILFLVVALFSAGSMFVYNYSNINKQEDKDSSKKEPIDKEDSTGKIQNPADEKQKSTGKTLKNHESENNNFTGETQNQVIENSKSTKETQEYTYKNREHENQGSTTNDSNKYPKTDNGFGTKNFKVILPVTLGSTAGGVVSSAAAGVTKHFRNKNRQK